ncbi:mpv17 pmp22 family [Fusarium albosuccineum]|uniref:Mpv17 pmp22 family n=1 Tax=Fusarium albosuccineum TaxID=1237068 RepID=A0A8H4PEN7_9HYPO|nr:mpv17 pmp22 family [Fusarium albosuccineum]
MATPMLLRAALRRNGLCFGPGRLPRVQRRLQSSAGKPPKTEESIPVPSTVAPLPLWQRLGPLTTAAQAYARSQKKRPLATQVATAVFIYICADFSAQYVSGNEYNPARTTRNAIIGAAVAIPNYKWFMFLSHNFNYSSRLLSLGTKIAVSQTVFTPIFNTFFFGAQAILSGENLQGTVERVKDTVPTSIINSAKLWPVVTAFSFSFLPIDYRPLFHGVVAVGWQTYLSFLNRQAELKEAHRHEAVHVDEKQGVIYAVPQAA